MSWFAEWEEEEEAAPRRRPPRTRGPIAEAILRHREELRERASDEDPDTPAERRPPSRPRSRTDPLRRPPRGDVPIRSLAGLALLTVVVAVGIGAAVLLWPSDGGREPSGGTQGAPGSADQQVVGWFVTDAEETDEAFVGVVAVGGGRSPVALVIPSYTVTNIPGYGTAAIADALASPDPEVAASAVANILGVKLDAWHVTSLENLRPVVDAVGGVEVADGPLDGDGVVRSLRRGGGEAVAAELRFLRWQEVLGGLLESADGRVELLGPLGSDVARALVVAGGEGAQVLELPVQDIGSGLARPDAKAADALVAEWFVPTARTAKEVRLVVMNGVGTPGVAQRVARVLVPSGFELVSSLNAVEFNVQETRIVAARDHFLPEAELARELLGTGEVFVGRQPTGLADVTVIVGADFGGR